MFVKCSAFAAGFFSTEHLVNDRRCTAGPRVDDHRPLRAIALAGPAFDAGITLSDLDLSIRTPKHLASANGKTDTAAIAYFRVVNKRDNIFEINHGLHSAFYLTKRAIIHRRRPAPVPPISSGRAKRISFFTPESEVKVDDPVKFIAK